MKRLILVGGPMGVGKSAVCEELLRRLEPGVYLDGDWCWHMSPFSVTEGTKAMVLDNICALLGRFLRCDELDNVIFGWVMHQQEIIDTILSCLPLENVSVKRFSLLASPEALGRRLERDVRAGRRAEGVIERSLAYLPLYQELDTIRIDTDGLTPGEAADWIARQVREEGNDGKI